MSSPSEATVSILMAAHDAQATILRAVASVLAQSWRGWELIIASDDGCDYVGLCAEHGLVDARIRGIVCRDHGRGPARARNAALAHARGAYVTVLDADDHWQPQRLAQLLPLAATHGAATDNVRAVNSRGREIGRAFSSNRTGPFALGPEALLSLDLPLFPLVRREIWGEGYLPGLAVAEDVHLNLALVARLGAMHAIPVSLTDYVQRPTSLCNRPDASEMFEHAYDRIGEEIASGRLAFPADVRPRVLGALAEKARRNRAFARWRQAHPGGSFQEFAESQRRTHVCTPPPCIALPPALTGTQRAASPQSGSLSEPLSGAHAPRAAAWRDRGWPPE